MRSLLMAIALLSAGGAAAAQGTAAVALSVDAGPAFPLGEFADDGARVGWGRSASVTVRFTRLFGLSAGCERTSFGLEAFTANPGDGTWTDSGCGVGGRVWLPTGSRSRVLPWAQLGIGRHNLDSPIGGPAFGQLDTDGVGTLEGGGGIDVALAAERLLIRPTLRFRRYHFALEGPESTATTNISSLTLALGVVFVLGRPSGAGERLPDKPF